MKTISVLVLGDPAERIEMYEFSMENALVWTRALIFHSCMGVSYMPLI